MNYKRYAILLLVLSILAACTPNVERMETTQVVATAVATTSLTATTLPTATAIYPQISPTETISFTQTTHRYTVQYPVGFYLAPNGGIESDSNFATQPNAEDLIAMSHQDFWITIRVEDNPEGWSLDQWADWQLLPRGTDELIVAGIPARQGSGDLMESGNGHGGFAIATYFIHNEQIFTVMGLSLTPDTLTHYTPVYQRLLDSFRFLPDSATDVPSPDTPGPSPVTATCPDNGTVINLPASSNSLRILFLNDDLWLWREETETAVPLTNGGAVTAYSLASNNSAIAFVQDGNLWIQYDGQTAVQITENSTIDSFNFSQDGQFIAYSIALGSDQYELRIAIVNSEGGATRLKETVSAADTWARHPDAEKVEFVFNWMDDTHILTYSFSPTLLGIGDTPPQPGFHIDADTGLTVDALTAEATPDSPYGYKVTFVTQADGQSELHLISTTDGHTALTLPAVLLPLWTLSPNGRFLIASATESVVIVDLADLSQWTAPVPYSAIGVSHYATSSPSVWVDEMTWYTTTPDGDDVFQPGATFTLWQINLVEKLAAPLNSYRGAILDAEFSPDQRHLAFWEETGNGIRNLHLVDLLTGEDVLYENGRKNLLFDHWLSDSTHFVYEHQNKRCLQLGHLSQPPITLAIPTGQSDIIVWGVDETRYVLVDDYLSTENGSSGTLYFQSLHGEKALIGPFTGTDGYSFTPYFEEP